MLIYAQRLRQRRIFLMPTLPGQVPVFNAMHEHPVTFSSNTGHLAKEQSLHVPVKCLNVK